MYPYLPNGHERRIISRSFLFVFINKVQYGHGRNLIFFLFFETNIGITNGNVKILYP